MLPHEWQSMERLLVIQPGDATDLPHLTSALQVLRRSLPLTQITVLVAVEQQAGMARLPSVDMVLSVSAAEVNLSDADAILQLIEKVRLEQFDGALLFTHPGESPYSWAYVAYLADIPLRVGASHEFGGGLLSQTVQPLLATYSDRSDADNPYIKMLASVGIAMVEPATEQPGQISQDADLSLTSL